MKASAKLMKELLWELVFFRFFVQLEVLLDLHV